MGKERRENSGEENRKVKFGKSLLRQANFGRLWELVLRIAFHVITSTGPCGL
jgi:hypothetical protein